MSQRQKQWARRVRQDLIRLLGGCCTYCGSDRKLEFHHPEGTEKDLSQLDTSARMSLYRREIKLGLIELACKKCNRSIGQPSRQEPLMYIPPTDPNIPF